MRKLKNYKQFSINEMAGYNETMTIEDLIYVLEQKPKDNFIVAHNEELMNKNRDGEFRFLLNDFEEIVPPEGMTMEMSNVNYRHTFSGKKYRFFTHNVETNKEHLMGHTYVGDKELPEETNLPPHKTIGELITILKQIPNPDKALFFIPGQPMGYEKTEYEYCFEAPRALATYNITSYPLTKNGEIVSGKIGADYDHRMGSKSEDAANMFMGEGSEGRYVLKFEDED